MSVPASSPLLAPHPFSLRQLQYVVAVAKELSFRRAAQRCHVAQPSLSAQIADLEARLGSALFERDRRRVLVTPFGHEFVRRAEEILRAGGDLVEWAKRTHDFLSQTVRIGVIPTVSPYLLPQVAAAFRASYRGLKVLWIEEKTELLVQALGTGTLDAALLALEADLGEVEHEVIGTDPFVLAAPLGHRLSQKRGPVHATELSGSDVLLLDEGHCLRKQALSFCASANTHELEVRATSLGTLAQMVSGGAGVTLLPSIAVATEAKRAKLVIRNFRAPAPARTLALVWRRRSPHGQALRKLAATARQAFERL